MQGLRVRTVFLIEPPKTTDAAYYVQLAEHVVVLHSAATEFSSAEWFAMPRAADATIDWHGYTDTAFAPGVSVMADTTRTPTELLGDSGRFSRYLARRLNICGVPIGSVDQ